MENGNISSKQRIKAYYSTLTEKEKIVADYISENPDIIIHSTISQVAESLNIAEATVFRLCKRLGFKGYQALKIALASEIVTGIEDIHETIDENDSVKQVNEKVFYSNIRTLEATLSLINPDTFQKAVQLLLAAKRIEFYGNGGSGIIALDAHHKFLRTGIPTAAYGDVHFQLMSASQLTKDDVLVLISHSGTNQDMLEILDVAKEQEIPTVGITNLSKTPFSEGVDIALFTESQETEYRSEALASRLAQLCIIDALYVNVSIKRKEFMKQSLQGMREAISRKRM